MVKYKYLHNIRIIIPVPEKFYSAKLCYFKLNGIERKKEQFSCEF